MGEELNMFKSPVGRVKLKRFMNGNGTKAGRGLALDIIVGGKKINAYLGQLEGERSWESTFGWLLFSQ